MPLREGSLSPVSTLSVSVSHDLEPRLLYARPSRERGMIRREARTRQGGLAGKGVEARRAATARPLLAVVAVTVRRRRGGQRRRGGRIRRPRRVGRGGRRDEVRARVELARELEPGDWQRAGDEAVKR